MAVLIVGAEKNFAALRPRLFEGRISTKVAGEVADAIREANPDVDLDKLVPGTVLTIPEQPKVRVRGELSFDDATIAAVEGLAQTARAALDEILAAAAVQDREAAAERKQLARALDAKEVATTMRKEPDLKADVEAVKEALEAEQAMAKEHAAALKQARSEWTDELDTLIALLEQ